MRKTRLTRTTPKMASTLLKANPTIPRFPRVSPLIQTTLRRVAQRRLSSARNPGNSLHTRELKMPHLITSKIRKLWTRRSQLNGRLTWFKRGNKRRKALQRKNQTQNQQVLLRVRLKSLLIWMKSMKLWKSWWRWWHLTFKTTLS